MALATKISFEWAPPLMEPMELPLMESPLNQSLIPWYIPVYPYITEGISLGIDYKSSINRPLKQSCSSIFQFAM
jgi:hypothetical protein